jgi:methylisocitrate lyase
MCIDAQVVIAAAFVAQRDMLKELRETGDYKTITAQQMVDARQEIEDIIDLSNYYEIEAATVES